MYKLFQHLRLIDWRGLTILWALFILGLSSIPGSEIPDSKLLEYDKIGHFGIYAILAFLMFGFKWKQDQGHSRSWKRYISPIIWSSTLGITMELLQGYVLVGRYFDLIDVIANIIGSIVGAVFASWILNKKNHEFS